MYINIYIQIPVIWGIVGTSVRTKGTRGPHERDAGSARRVLAPLVAWGGSFRFRDLPGAAFGSIWGIPGVIFCSFWLHFR